MELTESVQELLKAAGDIPIGMLCIPMAAAIARTKTEDRKLRRMWAMLFICLGMAAFLGAAAHGLVMKDMTLRWLWVWIYLLMFLLLVLFFALSGKIFCGGQLQKRKNARAIGLAVPMYMAAAGMRLLTGKNMIAIFVALALVLTVMIAAMAVKDREGTAAGRLLRGALAVLLGGLACQIAAVVVPAFHGAAIAHIFILFAMLIIYMAAKRDMGA